jgi:hypothetical protein
MTRWDYVVQEAEKRDLGRKSKNGLESLGLRHVAKLGGKGGEGFVGALIIADNSRDVFNLRHFLLDGG